MFLHFDAMRKQRILLMIQFLSINFTCRVLYQSIMMCNGRYKKSKTIYNHIYEK